MLTVYHAVVENAAYCCHAIDAVLPRREHVTVPYPVHIKRRYQLMAQVFVGNSCLQEYTLVARRGYHRSQGVRTSSGSHTCSYRRTAFLSTSCS